MDLIKSKPLHNKNNLKMSKCVATADPADHRKKTENENGNEKYYVRVYVIPWAGNIWTNDLYCVLKRTNLSKYTLEYFTVELTDIDRHGMQEE